MLLSSLLLLDISSSFPAGAKQKSKCILDSLTMFQSLYAVV